MTSDERSAKLEVECAITIQQGIFEDLSRRMGRSEKLEAGTRNVAPRQRASCGRAERSSEGGAELPKRLGAQEKTLTAMNHRAPKFSGNPSKEEGTVSKGGILQMKLCRGMSDLVKGAFTSRQLWRQPLKLLKGIPRHKQRVIKSSKHQRKDCSSEYLTSAYIMLKAFPRHTQLLLISIGIKMSKYDDTFSKKMTRTYTVYEVISTRCMACLRSSRSACRDAR